MPHGSASNHSSVTVLDRLRAISIPGKGKLRGAEEYAESEHDEDNNGDGENHFDDGYGYGYDYDYDYDHGIMSVSNADDGAVADQEEKKESGTERMKSALVDKDNSTYFLNNVRSRHNKGGVVSCMNLGRTMVVRLIRDRVSM